MTASSTSSGTRASHAALRPRIDLRAFGDPSRWRRALMAAAAVTVGFALAVTAPSTSAEASVVHTATAATMTAPTVDPSPSPSAPEPLSGTLETFVSPASAGVLRHGHDLNVQVAVRNGTPVSTAAMTVTLSLSRVALTDRTTLSAWLTKGDAPSSLTAVGDAKVKQTTSGKTASAAITVPADDDTLSALTPGVYPLQAAFAGPARTHRARSVVVVPDTKASVRRHVALIVPIDAGASTTGLLDADRIAELTAPDGALTADLNAVAGTSAILAIDPAIPAAIRVLGNSAPESARDWLERLELLPNARFALQFGDADLAVQLHNGRTSPLSPTSLESFIDPDDFPVDSDGVMTGSPASVDTEQASPTPSPSPSTPGPDDEVPLPDLAALQSLGPHVHDGVYWPFTGTVGATDASALATASSASDPVTLVSSSSLAGVSSEVAVAAHGRTAGADILAYDSAISSALRTASEQEDPAVRGSSLATVTGALMLSPAQADDAPLLVTVDRSDARTGLGLAAAVEAIGRAPDTSPATLTDLLRSPSHPVQLNKPAASKDRGTAFTQLMHDESALSSFSSVLEDPSVLTGPQRAQILQLLGSGWLGDADGWERAITAHAEAAEQTLNAVAIAPTSDTINLAGTAAPLHFGVRNDLPWPVNVQLNVQSDDLRLEVEPVTEVTAQPGSTTRVSVPVKARIGTGEVHLTLVLHSPTLVKIDGERTVTVNVRADWEVIGLVILGVAVAAFLILGLVRTVIARRRRAAAGDDEAEGQREKDEG